MKKNMMVMVMAAAAMLSLAACGQNTVKTVNAETQATISIQTETHDDIVGMPSPMKDFESLKEAVDSIGFELTVPEKIDGYTEIHYSTISDEIIQVIYREGDDQLCIRKAKGSLDISGDYNKYEKTEKKTFGEQDVEAHLNEDGIHRMNWEKDGYSYSVTSYTGMSEEQAAELVAVVK